MTLSVVRDRPPSVAHWGAVPGAENLTQKLQCALNESRAVFVPPGVYEVNGPLSAQPTAEILGTSWEATRISRVGVWPGDTLTVSAAFKISGLLFEQLHPGFIQGTSTTMVDRLTADQSHICIEGGTGGRIENCWFQGAPHSVDVRGTTNLVISQCYFGGSWDRLNTNISESLSYIRFRHSGLHGLVTMPQIINCYLSGGPLVNRSYTEGGVTFSLQGNGGAQFGMEIQGAEGLQMYGGYLGGQNVASVYIGPTGICTNLHFHDFFMDGAELASFYLTTQGQVSNMINIHNIGFNGQQATQYLMLADNPVGQPVVNGLMFKDNICQGYNKCAMRLDGVNVGLFENNIISGYNSRGGYSAATPDGSSAFYVSGASRKVHISGGQLGGNINSFDTGSHCAWGAYFVPPTTGSVESNVQYALGLAGGSAVCGLTPFVRSSYH